MNSTIDRPWYTQHCVPFMAIEACPREGDQARRVWAAVYIAMDISSLLFISATLIRRWIYVAEPFNTLRLMLIKFLLSLPLQFTWAVARVWGGKTQYGFSAYTMGGFIAFNFMPGIAGIAMLASTWLTLSRESVSTRHPILGSTKIYALLVAPCLIVITITGMCGAISFAAYNVCWRIFFLTWMWFLWSITLLTIINCVQNLRRFDSEELQFHRGQLIKTTVGICIIFGCAGSGCIFQASFQTQIDNSEAGFNATYSIYRICFWFLINGGALYAWMVTTYRIQTESSGSVRSSKVISNPAFAGKSNDSLGAPQSPRPVSLQARNMAKNETDKEFPV